MTTVALVLTLLVSYALAFAIQEGKLPEFIDERIESLRENSLFFEKLFGCIYCLGFWTGLISYGLILVALQELTLTWSTITLWPLVGLASSTTCYILNQITLIGIDEDEMPPELEAILNRRKSLRDLQESGSPAPFLIIDSNPEEEEDYCCGEYCLCSEEDEEEDEEDEEEKTDPKYKH